MNPDRTTYLNGQHGENN